jgi:gentisate 1,2-dioxygenase
MLPVLGDDELARLCEGIVYICSRVSTEGMPGCGFKIVSLREVIKLADREYHKAHGKKRLFLNERCPNPKAVGAALRKLEADGHLLRPGFRTQVTRSPDMSVFDADQRETLRLFVDRYVDAGLKTRGKFRYPRTARPAQYGEWSEL